MGAKSGQGQCHSSSGGSELSDFECGRDYSEPRERAATRPTERLTSRSCAEGTEGQRKRNAEEMRRQENAVASALIIDLYSIYVDAFVSLTKIRPRSDCRAV